jgi:hypothetical protein
MSHRTRIVAVVVGLLLGFLAYLLLRPAAAPSPVAGNPGAPSAPPGTPAPPRPAPTPPPAAALPDFPLNAPGTDIHSDLRLVAAIVGMFRTNFPRDGNPTGSNAEITATLTGANKLRLVLIPPRHPAINADGELCDRWGTPFFFHAESATRMEIRSAGPDRRLWTDDDAAFAP